MLHKMLPAILGFSPPRWASTRSHAPLLSRSLPLHSCAVRACTREEGTLVDHVPPSKASRLPRQWILFTDLHVQKDTLPYCLELLRRVADEARSRSAGVICLGDFWHAGGILHTRQLNQVLQEVRGWGEQIPLLMIPGNHDQAMRGNPDPLLHALTPIGLASPGSVHIFSRPTLLEDSLWVPYGVTAAEMRVACAHATTYGPLRAVFCHADIVGGLMSDGAVASKGLPPDAFPPLPTLVYSGHYHKPHVVAEPMARGRHIRYAGSPYQTSMAEAGQAKALLVLDRKAGWAVCAATEPTEPGPARSEPRLPPNEPQCRLHHPPGIHALQVTEQIPLDIGPRHHVLREPSAETLEALGSSLRSGDRVLVLARQVSEALQLPVLVVFAAS